MVDPQALQQVNQLQYNINSSNKKGYILSKLMNSWEIKTKTMDQSFNNQQLLKKINSYWTSSQ